MKLTLDIINIIVYVIILSDRLFTIVCVCASVLHVSIKDVGFLFIITKIAHFRITFYWLAYLRELSQDKDSKAGSFIGIFLFLVYALCL